MLSKQPSLAKILASATTCVALTVLVVAVSLVAIGESGVRASIPDRGTTLQRGMPLKEVLKRFGTHNDIYFTIEQGKEPEPSNGWQFSKVQPLGEDETLDTSCLLNTGGQCSGSLERSLSKTRSAMCAFTALRNGRRMKCSMLHPWSSENRTLVDGLKTAIN